MVKILTKVSITFLLISFTSAILVNQQVTVNGNAQVTRTNFVCQIGYYWTTQSCQMCMPVLGPVGSYCSCSNYLGCDSIQCPAGYQQNYNTSAPACIQLPIGCSVVEVVNGAAICQQCATGYTAVGAICLSNSQQNCGNFDANTGKCLTCNQGYYYNNQFSTLINPNEGASNYYLTIQSQCSNCINNCQACISGFNCTKCQPGFLYVSNQDGTGTCSACPAGCNDCSTTITSCNTCNSGYYLTAAKGCGSCLGQISGCAACSIPSGQTSPVCSQCQSGYTLNGNTCTPPLTCPSGCSQCSSTSTCTQCSAGYILSNGSCYACPSNCQSCEFNSTISAATCQTCKDTFMPYSTSNGATACKGCNTANNTFTRCNSATEPTQCIDGYFLVNGTCVQQATNNYCLTVNSNNTDCNTCLQTKAALTAPSCASCTGQCLSCSQSTGSYACSQCATTYLLSSTSTSCIKCLGNCATCTTNSSNCQQCNPNYYLNGTLCYPCSDSGCSSCTNNVCTTCKDGYYLLTNLDGTKTCTQCLSGCLKCSSGTQCSTCPPSTYLLSNGTCVSLSSTYCLKAKSTTGCDACIYGFYMNSTTSQCEPCLDLSESYVCRDNSGNALVPVTPTINPTTPTDQSTNTTPPSTNTTSNSSSQGTQPSVNNKTGHSIILDIVFLMVIMVGIIV